MFGSKKNKEETEGSNPSTDLALFNVWPTKSRFFNEFRTDAYENAGGNYIECWVAIANDAAAQHWRVMHYMIFNIDDHEDYNFIPEVVIDNCDFKTAVEKVCEFGSMTASLGDLYKKIEITAETHPPEKYPGLQGHFFGIEPYDEAIKIEGLTLDKAGIPHPRTRGLICQDGVYKLSANAEDVAEGNPHTKFNLQPGVLSDMFKDAAGRDLSISMMNLKKVSENLKYHDVFVLRMAAFYLDLQKKLGMKASLDEVEGVATNLKKEIFDLAIQRYSRSYPDFDSLFNSLNDAVDDLCQAEKEDIYVEPYLTHLAELEIYVRLLKGSGLVEKYHSNLSSPDPDIADFIDQAKESVDAAKEKFLKLGGTESNFDILESWVTKTGAQKIPHYIPGFISCYYAARDKMVEKVKANRMAEQSVKTVAADVKPLAG